MQLGTRWRFGTTPPNRLNSNMLQAIQDAEGQITRRSGQVTAYAVSAESPSSLSSSPQASSAMDSRASSITDAANSYWTLTWLEGRAVCELDDGTQVLERRGGDAVIVPASEDFHGAGAAPNDASHSPLTDAALDEYDDDDDDDDDWLRA